MADSSLGSHALAAIDAWFSRTGGGGLILPNGWYGKPNDNIHQLTFSEVRPRWIIVELDEHLLLSFRGSTMVQDRGPELAIFGFSSLVFDRTDYGADTGDVSTFADGEVRLVAPPGA